MNDMWEDRDEHKEIGRLPVQPELSKEAVEQACKDPEMLNAIYREISESLGIDTAMEIYQMFKGQQVTFPMRLYSGATVSKRIMQEYDGTNIKKLAAKYGYSEKTIRRIIRKG